MTTKRQHGRENGSLRDENAHMGAYELFQRKERHVRYQMVSFSSSFVILMLLQTVVNTAHAQATNLPDTEDPALAGAVRPSCSIFVDASLKQNRFLLVHGYEDDAEVIVLDQFPSVVPGLGDLPPSEAYQQLRPGFMSIADYLRAQSKPLLVHPRHCHTHLLVANELQRHMGTQKLDNMLKEILQASIEDAQFPFMFSRDDLRVVDSRSRGYYQMIGVNFLDGRIVQTLAPGAVELSGVLSLHDNSLLVAFDQQERWRRGIRRKQLSRPLNTTDFFIFEHQDYVQDRLHFAMARYLFNQEQVRLQSANPDVKKPVPPKVPHPCLPQGTKETIPVVGAAASGMLFEGTGDAKACITTFADFLKQTNKDCPAGSYCLVNSVSQPKPVSPFFASGKFVSVARFTNDVLTRLKKQAKTSEEAEAEPLDLPLPTLAQVRKGANLLCSTPGNVLAEWDLPYDDNRSVTRACFDLCQVVVLLQQLGVEENEKRIVFGEPLAPSTRGTTTDLDLTNRNFTTSSSANEVSWVVGVFLVLQLLDKRQTFSMESDHFAEQIGVGVPLGINMSILVFIGVIAFLYLTTGARPSKTKSGGYRVASTSSNSSINSSNRQSSGRMSTSAIVFVDDASE